MSGLLFDPQKIRVLIIDDHELIRKSIIKVLGKLRIEQYTEAWGTNDAVKILDSEAIDLVLCDLYLSNSKGLDILQYVRNRDTKSDIPFIVVTGEASKDDIVKAADMGAEDYILKPFQAVELEKKVLTVLNRYFNPTLLVANIRNAEKHLLEKDFAAAKSSIAAALKLDPQSAQAAHLAALIHSQCGEYATATQLLGESIRNNPSYLKNYRALANIHLAANNPLEAAKAMRHELELNPKQPERQVMLAKILQKSGNLLGSAEHFRQALLEDGKMKAALFGMGRVQAEIGHLDKAIYYFKRLRRHHPKNTRALEAIVQSSIAADNARLAEMTLRDEKKQYPRRLDTYVVLAKFYAMTERAEEALQVIQDALAVDPAYVEGLKVKGLLLHKTGDLDGALECFKLAIQTAPELESYLQIAEILIEKKAFPEATQVLHVILKSGQQNPRALVLLALAMFHSKQITKAYLLAHRLLQMGIQTPQIKEMAQKSRLVVLNRRRQPGSLAS